MAVAERELAREVRRLFRRFDETGAYVARLAEGDYGLFVARNRWRRPVLRLDARIWRDMEARDLVTCRETRENAGIWIPSEAGRAWYRRLEAAADPFQTQHRTLARKAHPDPAEKERVTVNEGESPLGWLRRRKGAHGKPLIGETEFEAGERLRRDFTLGRMTARVTADWAMALAPGEGARSPRDPAEASDRALAARERLSRALGEVGPGLAEPLYYLCCELEGLEAVERRFGWPPRSGKVVLQIALARLAKHYGMG
ncbi:hypothetical protein FHS78_002787 [Parvibaculum indicum]|uniref:DUF6456 domain-containing protein n=1 Tax=Parvibaculum indicum TaxID=562969 RepID=UPI0014200295|nr:hypothetical protein [Parvibaculum indicum]